MFSQVSVCPQTIWQTPPWGDTPLQQTVNKRTVRIRLKCILVQFNVHIE